MLELYLHSPKLFRCFLLNYLSTGTSLFCSNPLGTPAERIYVAHSALAELQPGISSLHCLPSRSGCFYFKEWTSFSLLPIEPLLKIDALLHPEWSVSEITYCDVLHHAEIVFPPCRVEESRRKPKRADESRSEPSQPKGGMFILRRSTTVGYTRYAISTTLERTFSGGCTIEATFWLYKWSGLQF
jgi:hypothetical protein